MKYCVLFGLKRDIISLRSMECKKCSFDQRYFCYVMIICMTVPFPCSIQLSKLLVTTWYQIALKYFKRYQNVSMHAVFVITCDQISSAWHKDWFPVMISRGWYTILRAHGFLRSLSFDMIAWTHFKRKRS